MSPITRAGCHLRERRGSRANRTDANDHVSREITLNSRTSGPAKGLSVDVFVGSVPGKSKWEAFTSQGSYFTNDNLVAAASLMTAVPTVVVFLVLSKQFISGLTLGADKG